jgi:3-dehydroquinate synthetase
MSPTNDDLVARFDKLDSKFDELRRELMASFVLKQVFDIAMEARDKEVAELKKEFDAQKQNEMGRTQRLVAIGGGVLGSISTILYIFHLIGVMK